jgi:hypothetical protein
VADDKGVNVKAAGCENARYAGEDSGFVLHEAIQDVSFWGSHGGRGRFVEDVRYGGLG